jgi:transcriptional regulator with GAF, ATPase, and Fis domain
MHIEALSTFTNYLSLQRRSIEEICQHLVLHVFKSQSARAVYIGLVESEGYLSLKATFGFKQDYIEQWKRIPLTLNIPIIEAVRSESEVIFLTREDFFANYPQVTTLGTVDHEWESCVTTSIQSDGAFMLIFNEVPKVDPEFNFLLRSTGHLIALHLEGSVPIYKAFQNAKTSAEELTPRQKIIRDLLAKGFTNAHIAKEIGYSESLVRQESIVIYAAHRISGRRELINLMEMQPSKPA